MKFENVARASRRTLSLPFGGRKNHTPVPHNQVAALLSTVELKQLVAAMVD